MDQLYSDVLNKMTAGRGVTLFFIVKAAAKPNMKFLQHFRLQAYLATTWYYLAFVTW